MVLHFIGLGLDSVKDISFSGLDKIKMSEAIYLENYTSILNSNTLSEMEAFYGKNIFLADRDFVEKNVDDMLDLAKTKDVSFLVVGDVFSATTHTDLYLRARQKDVQVTITNNASVLNAIGNIGLELYKCGKTTSLVFFEDSWKPRNAYDTIKANASINAHTVVLLDIKMSEPSITDLQKGRFDKKQPPRFMSVSVALQQLLELENMYKESVLSEETEVIGCARLGSSNQKVVFGKIKDLILEDFGPPLHCLVIPSKCHFIEEEMLSYFRKK